MRDICEIHTVTSGPVGHTHAYPTCRTWSRDGKSIFAESYAPVFRDLGLADPDNVVQVRNPETPAGGPCRLLAVDIETGEQTILAESPEGGFQFDYSPGANVIAYTDSSVHYIHVVNLDTMASGVVWHEPEGVIGGPLSISHDGTRIAFWAMMPSVGSRWFDSEITAIFALDADPVNCGLVKPAWVVEAYPRRKLANGAVHVNHPQINPANKDHICYSHEMHGATPDGSVAMCRLWQTMADGEANRYLVRQPAGLHFTHEVIAPDGKSLVFPYMFGVGQVDFGSFEKRSLYYNPDCCPGHLTVSPDQNWIAGDTWGDWRDARGNAVQSIMMFEVASRKWAHLCWIPRSRGHPVHPHPNFSPDGTKIAFARLADGVGQVAHVDVSEAMANWDAIAQGTGGTASPDW